MAIATGLIRAAANTSTGNQDFRDPNMTTTPNAAIFIITEATADNSAAASAVLGYGVATSTTARWCVGISSQDAADPTVSKKVIMTDQCLCILLADGTAVDGEADFVQFLADAGSGAGVQINWGNAPASAFLVTVILIAASNAVAGTFLLPTSAGSTVTATPGFEADIVLTGYTAQSSADSIGNDAHVCFGAAHNNGAGTITQRCTAFRSRHNFASGNLLGRAQTDRVAISLSNTATEEHGGEVTSFTSTTFVVTERTASGGSNIVGYLALDFGSISSVVASWSSPTSTGDQGITSAGFEPQLVISLLWNGEAFATAYTDNKGGSIGFGTWTENNRYSNVVSDEDAAPADNSQSLSDDTAVNLPDDDGAAQCVASFVSLDGTGFTLNHTAVAATAKQWWYVAIQVDGVAPSVVAVDTLSLTLSVPDITLSLGAVSLPVDTLSMVLSAQDVTVQSSVSILMDSLSMVLSAQDLIVSPGATLVAMDTLSLVTSLQNLSVSPGAISVLMDTLSLVASLQDLVVAGGIIVGLDTLTLVVAAQDLIVSPGAVSVPVDTLTLVSSLQDIDAVPGGVSVLMDTLTTILSLNDLDVVPGSISVGMDTLSLVLSIPDTAVQVGGGGAVVVVMDSLSLLLSPVMIFVLAGESTSPYGTAVLAPELTGARLTSGLTGVKLER